MKLTTVGCAVALLAVPPLAVAHHSFAAQYDRNKPITLTGVVSKLDWVNPHVYIYVDVKDASGATVTWALESNSTTNLIRQGWSRNSLKIGEQVTVEAFLARDGTKLANAQTITTADGRKVFGVASGNYPIAR